MKYKKDCVVCPNCKSRKDAYLGSLDENLCDRCDHLNPYDAEVRFQEMPWPEVVDGKERRVLIDERGLIWEEVWGHACQIRKNRRYYLTDGSNLSPAAQSYIRAARNHKNGIDYT